MKLIELISVAEDPREGWYDCQIMIDFENGQTPSQHQCIYSPDDHVGLSDAVGAAITQWKADLKTIAPYVPPAPPTPEELREAMPPLSPRQIRLALLSIGITEDDVDAKLAGDAEGLIEWKYATQYLRTDPLLVSMGQAFELPPEQIDSLWTWAADK